MQAPLNLLGRRGWYLVMILAGPLAAPAAAQLVPGSGDLIAEVGDDFEDEKWQYVHNAPKASKEIDKQRRLPAGYAANGRWAESMLRGSPDLIRRVATPDGGLEGSSGSLLLRTLNSGVPGMHSGKHEQDDLIVNCSGRLRGQIPVSWSPSCTVRVYLPPWDQWEPRSATSFGFRAELWATSRGKYDKEGNRKGPEEPYWPGFFIQFNSKADGRHTEDSAQLIMRCGNNGRDFLGPEIKEPGWWTLGMSFTPDGRVHYYAHAGVEDLTSADYLATQYPYGFRALRFQSFFFNISNLDNGRSWSTPWVIDDPMLFYFRNGNSGMARARTNPVPGHVMKTK